MKFYILMLIFISALFSENYYDNGKLVELIPIKDRDVSSVIKLRDNSSTLYFKDSNGNTVGTTDELIIKYNGNFDINKVIKLFDIEVLDSSVESIYLLKVNNSNKLFDIAKSLYNLTGIEASTPNFIREKRYR